VGISIAIIILIYSRSQEKEIARQVTEQIDKLGHKMSFEFNHKIGTSQERYIDEIKTTLS